MACAVGVAQAQTTAPAGTRTEDTREDALDLPEFVLVEERVANQVPASTFAAPVSALRYEPQVDLQVRNFGEAQGDIAIRGGIFEGTAMRVGGMTIFDPQTGHYAAELPIPPQMLSAPAILTGADHAFGSMQATVGTVGYAWRAIRAGGEATAAIGNGGLNRQSLYAAEVIVDDRARDRRVAVDAGWARSEADGTIRHGDHRFQRVAGRVQVSGARGSTELFGGYQAKFFGWPNLYTPFGVAETENLQTTLIVLSHRQQMGESSLEAGAHYRRNKDDYEFDRFRPGLFNPYQHETDASGAFVAWRTRVGGWGLDLRAEGVADSIDSTALTFGHFSSRSYWKLGGAVRRTFGLEDGSSLETRLGATLDDTNRDGSALSPVIEVAWAPALRLGEASPRVYAQYSGATRVPGYTALNSNPDAGLFRGDPDLGREKSGNLEAGLEARGRAWSARAAVFLRRDARMADWTFSYAAENARTAREVAIDTTGVELLVSRSFGAVDVVAGYGWLGQEADYRGAPVDASFYALNFPRHRLTFAVVARLGAGFELHADNEYRVQRANALRRVGGDEALHSSLGLSWVVPRLESLELSLVVDNLWKDNFQELPAVPAAGRQVTFGAAWHW